MPKYDILTGGDGTIGQSGLDVRNILNNQIPNNVFYIPQDFDFSVSLSPYQNRTWVINNEHTLTGSISLPQNVTLLFDGGKISGAYTITGSTTIILNPRNTHIFDLAVNFAGSWTQTVASPMWFGAKTTANPNVLPGQGATSSSPALQKLFDSPFDVYFPKGYYYINAATTINRPIRADFGPRYESQGFLDIARNLRVWKTDHVRFYTDQNINFWNIFSHGVYLLGGVMDVHNATGWNKAIYYMHCDYKVFGGEVSGYCIGNKTLVKSGSTGKALHWDTANATQDWGYACNFRGNVYSYCIPEGIVIDDYSIAKAVVTGTWSNMWYFEDTWIQGSRKAAILRYFSHATILGQDEAVISTGERDMSIIDVHGTGPIRIHIADLFNREEPVSSGWWYHKQVGAYKLHEENNLIVGNFEAILYNGYTGKPYRTTRDIEIGSRITQLRDSWDHPTCFISEINNMIPLYAADAEIISVKAYDGSSVNFDIDLADGNSLGLSESSNITITNPTDVFKYRGKYTIFNVTTSSLTDFIEIRVRFSSEKVFNNFYLALRDGRAATQRIQLIRADNAGTKILSEWPFQQPINESLGRRVIKFNFGPTSCREIIVRLIGFLGIYQYNAISDMATQGDPQFSQAFVNRLEKPKSEIHLSLNQSGTSAPTMTQHLNYYNRSITTSYQGVGSYRVNITTISGKTLPIETEIFTSAGSIKFIRSNSYYTIETRNPGGTLANGILSNQPLIITEYW